MKHLCPKLELRPPSLLKVFQKHLELVNKKGGVYEFLCAVLTPAIAVSACWTENTA